MAPLISLMTSVERCQFAHDAIMVPNIKPERKAMRVSLITNSYKFPCQGNSLVLTLEDTFTHSSMIESEILSWMILASWKSIFFPHTFHCAHLCHLLTFSNWFTTLSHIFPCTQKLNKTLSQYPISTEHLYINVPRGIKLWLQYMLSRFTKSRANLIKSS